jgi:hypothetical protein
MYLRMQYFPPCLNQFCCNLGISSPLREESMLKIKTELFSYSGAKKLFNISDLFIKTQDSKLKYIWQNMKTDELPFVFLIWKLILLLATEF